MKKAFFTLLFVVVGTALFAQNMASPPAKAEGKIGGTTVTINYHQPAVKGRNVWAGDLAPYGKVWRTGANNTTTIEFDKDVTIEGKALAKGKYGVFTIPGEKEWVIIFNKGIAWGAFSYKESDDVLRVTVKSMPNEMTERMTFAVNSDNVSLAWEKVKVAFKVK
ncbi:MAG: DUF2911 domain-containing protein [Spirosomataceae bacterium]